jgi:hypothetical protein
LARDADRALALFSETSVIEVNHAVPFSVQGTHHLNGLTIQVVLVPDHRGQQTLQALLGRIRDDGGKRVTILVGMFGQQAWEIAF